MKAEDVRLTDLLEGPKQFIVPVFQRDYSWGTKHCLQLWKDIVRVGSRRQHEGAFCRLGRLCSGGGELSQDHALALDRRSAEAHDRFASAGSAQKPDAC